MEAVRAADPDRTYHFARVKSNLGIRPVFHQLQRAGGTGAYIFICVAGLPSGVHAIERASAPEHGDHRSWPTIRDLLAEGPPDQVTSRAPVYERNGAPRCVIGQVAAR